MDSQERHPLDKGRYLADLGSKCQEAAGCLSFNEGPDEDRAKRLLLEASHALDSECIRYTPKKDGLLMSNARGKCRFMTWRERLACWLLKGKTEIRP